MKRYILYRIFLIIASAVLFQGCVREFENYSYQGEGEMIDLVIPFGAPQGTGVTVSTKAHLSLSDESHVFNMYLLIFDSGGKKIYGHYFDGSNLGTSTENNWWTVDNMPSASDPTTTTGTLHIRTAKKGGCTVVAVANMNPDDLDVSPGILSTIKTYGELNNVVATQVRSEIAANSGYFLMTGQLSGVDILGNTSDPNDISQNTLHLKRLYAKVSFKVQVGKAGAAAGIRKFVPDKWYVVNVPTCSYLMERTATPYVDAATDASQFFSTPELGFETEELAKDPDNPSNFVFYHDGVTKASCYGFAFYMMENRKAPYARSGGDALPSPFNYSHRELEIKDGAGLNQGWRYASEYSTYIVMTGKIVMGVTSGSNANATLDANVKYKIHLGNFASDNADFNILRNHTYKIYINGSDDIKTEVETGTENEPGATGRVVVAEEEVFDSDCHYSTQVISFHANLIDPSQISWYVETPFNPEGAGPNDGLELSDIDYKWVEFHVNSIGGDGKYSENRVLYEPHDWERYDELGIAPGTKGHTMYVNELVEYIKHQKSQYDLHLANPSLPASDFDSDTEPKITVTAFVNEYYYEEHPIKGGYDPTLWKLVVNHPMRRMHILASSAKSPDGESNMIGASFTLQQRSIQSIYAVHEVATLQSAWGMEFTDDDNETGASFYWKNKYLEDCGNTSATNGRINSLKLWGILNPDGTEKPGSLPRWDDYLNLTGTNETPHLLSDYDYLRYSCLSRNRDNDGDGFIDPEEIRWYMASDVQLIGVFLGSYGIEGDARLYQRNASDQAESDKDKWRQHIIASNRYIFTSSPPSDATNSNKYPRIVWAEEGVNGSNMSYTGSDQTSKFSTRCVRNLGYYIDGGQRKDITLSDPTVETDPYVLLTRKHRNEDGTVTSPYTGAYDTRTFYEFDCSHINLTSLREPVDHELVGHDEYSKMACLSSKFGTAPVIDLKTVGTHAFNGTSYDLTSFSGINNYLNACFPDLDSGFRICPEGYRLPNAREVSLMWTVLSALPTGDSAYLGNSSDSDGTFSRTYWSMGALGSQKAPTYYGWGMSSKHLLMALNQKFKTPRCVRDI